jgi:hypothetical protein
LALLEDAAQKGGFARWAVYLRAAIAEGSLNIEGAAVRGGAFYLGFKRPFLGNKSVIIAIADLEKVFMEKRISPESVSLFAELALPDGGRGEQTGISDLLWHGNALYVLSYTPRVGGKPHRSGNLWRYTAADRKTALLAHLDGMQPEGIAWHPGRRAFAICLDNGKDRPSALLYQEVP